MGYEDNSNGNHIFLKGVPEVEDARLFLNLVLDDFGRYFDDTLALSTQQLI